MPKSLSVYLDIPSELLIAEKAFDPILDVDTRLFLDPKLLKHTDVQEFVDSYSNLTEYFRNIATLLINSDHENDVFWRRADRLMEWQEVKGLCIGFTAKGTSGSGIGPELRHRLLRTSKEIISKGIENPELFEIVGLLEKDIGSDRISDMTANVIRSDLVNYTLRVMSSIEHACKNVIEKDPITGLPINPYTNQHILLVPRVLLRDIPQAFEWSEIDIVAKHNQELRDELNELIGTSWKQAVSWNDKNSLKKILLDKPELIRDVVEQYIEKPPLPYDFANDRAGEYNWYPASNAFAKAHPLKLALPQSPSIADVEDLVLKICNYFAHLIEHNGLEKLLYDTGGKPKHESASQLLFYGIAEAYCEANSLMISPESDAGRGPVDFKFGTRKENSVLVEVKKSTNTSGLGKGIEKQLPQYMDSEGARKAIYLVLDVGGSVASISKLKAINEKVKGTAIKILKVDATLKVSASKL